MHALLKLAYGVVSVGFFLYGLLVVPLTLERNKLADILYQDIGMLLGNNPLTITMLVVVMAALSGAIMYIIARLVVSQQKKFVPVIKLFFVSILANATGSSSAIVLGAVGLHEAAWQAWPILAATTVCNACGGIVGIVGLRRAAV